MINLQSFYWCFSVYKVPQIFVLRGKGAVNIKSLKNTDQAEAVNLSVVNKLGQCFLPFLVLSAILLLKAIV